MMEEKTIVNNIVAILGRINRLNTYLSYLDTFKNEIIVVTSVCDEGSTKWDLIHFPDFLNIDDAKPAFRKGFVSIIDYVNDYSHYEMSEIAGASYEFNNIIVEVESSGFESIKNKGNSKFTINELHLEIKKRGVNFMIISHDGSIIDLFNVDTHEDNTLLINRSVL